MALLTAGTNANNSLSAMLYGPAAAVADTASFQALIFDDLNPVQTIWPGSWNPTSGILYVPNRGILRARPGDYVMVDTTTGWPILVSAAAIASGPWTHS